MIASEEHLDLKMPKRVDLPSRPAGAELLLRETDSGKVHFLTATAALVWECCDGEMTMQDCAARLREAFAVPENVDLAADIMECLRGLRERGLVMSDTSDAN